MLKLHGFAMSNYYNTAKMALLEKGVEFEEVNAFPSQKDEYLARSPMGKVPCLETDDGFLSETSAIIEYLDDTLEGPALFPKDPWQRAKARELFKEVELYLDLAVRPCFPEVFFGGEVSDDVKAAGKASLEQGLAAIARSAKFDPYLAGAEMTPGDMLAYFSLPLATAVAGKFFGLNPVEMLEGAEGMLAAVADRPSAKTIAADSQKK
jgi:glutathione S-transferase